jgi:hypothetical protein
MQILPITYCWPMNYMSIMKSRVAEAQAYALERKQDWNVVSINFKRSA